MLVVVQWLAELAQDQDHPQHFSIFFVKPN